MTAALSTLKDSLFDTISRQTEKWTGVVTGAPESVRLVVEATNNEKWGPTGQQMRQIADLTWNYQECGLAMQTIWERLGMDTNSGGGWRNVYKSLLLLDYLIKNGSERVVNDSRQTSYQLKSLTTTHFVDSDGIDRGISIRERAKQIVDLLGDTNRLREERKKAKQNRDKYNAAYGSEASDFRRFPKSSSEWDDGFSKRPTGSTGLSSDEYADDYNNNKRNSDDEEEEYNNNNKSKARDDFEEFVQSSPATPVAPPKPSVPSNSNWDPFGIQTTAPSSGNTGAPDDWEEFNPRGQSQNVPQTFTWSSQPPTVPVPAPGPTISPFPSNPTPTTNNPPPSITALFPTSAPLPNDLTPTKFPQLPVSPVVDPGSPLKSSQPSFSSQPATPLKSSDPWAHSKLFDLSLSDKTAATGPSPVRSPAVGGKTLSSTVGYGWGVPSTTPATFTTPGYTPTYPTYPAGLNPPAYTANPSGVPPAISGTGWGY